MCLLNNFIFFIRPEKYNYLYLIRAIGLGHQLSLQTLTKYFVEFLGLPVKNISKIQRQIINNFQLKCAELSCIEIKRTNTNRYTSARVPDDLHCKMQLASWTIREELFLHSHLELMLILDGYE